jgi:hypothetical protein
MWHNPFVMINLSIFYNPNFYVYMGGEAWETRISKALMMWEVLLLGEEIL